MHGTLFLYSNNEDFRMTEECKIIEEELEQDALMAEALKVVENIMVFICCSELICGASKDKLRQSVTHMHLWEHSLTVLEEMELISQGYVRFNLI